MHNKPASTTFICNDAFMFYTFFRSAPEEGLYCKPKYRANLFKYILLVLAILFFVTSAVRISLPSVFCILDILLIQVYKRSGTTHRFVAVVLQIFIVFVTTRGPSNNFRVYLGVRTCEVFLCFVTIIFLGSIVLTSLFSLFYVTCERDRFLHRG